MPHAVHDRFVVAAGVSRQPNGLVVRRAHKIDSAGARGPNAELDAAIRKDTCPKTAR
ncbi:MAG: hypothetical protein Aurels2KO_04860 [Aureliella sp.]